MASNNAALDAAVAAATATLDRVKPPAGVIMPPPGEMREVIEKTAGYVVRGGAGIERRLQDNQGNNPKFGFVTNPNDAFHPYYEWRKEEYRAGRVTAIAAGRVGEGVAGAGGANGDANGGGDAGAAGKKGPEQPPAYEFSARLPIMHARDLEILRLTASFVAVHGRRFLTSLVQREVDNAQFQFLLPNHSLHNYFQRMVDQYTLILKDINAEKDEKDEKDTDTKDTKTTSAREETLAKADRFAVLLRAKQRVAFAEWEDSQRKKAEHAKVMEKEEMERIDWANFAVVETIVFTPEDDRVALPPPTTLNDLQYASLEEKSKISIGANRMLEEAFPV